MSGQDFAPPPPLLANRPRRRRTSIGLTPLIDVVFILIVFFMLASSFFDWRAIRLEAPSQAGGGGMAGTLLVEVRRDGLRLTGAPVSPEELSDRIAARIARDPDQRILVKVGDGVSVQQVVTVVDRLSARGAANLTLVRGAHR